MALRGKRIYPAKINDRLWIIGHYYFHHYLVRGDHKSALIETGVSATADEVIRQLADMKARPDFLIVTHPHGDHITGLPALRQAFPDMTVMAGPGAAAFASHPKIGPSFVRDDRFTTAFLQAHGLRNNRPPLSVAPTLEGCVVKSDGDILDLGNLTLAFHITKGHAPGHMVVEIPEIKALLLSDSLGFHYPASRRFFPVYFTGYADYVATIDRLAKVKADIVALAHQTVFMGEDAVQAFSLAKNNALDLKNRMIRDTRPDDLTAQELFDDYYRDELRINSPENIMNCCRILIRRSREAEADTF